MLILGVETSGQSAEVAICRDGQCLGVRSLPPSRMRHAQRLLLELQELLRECGLSLKEMQAVAVSRGPGSFTGLRIGIVFAKTLAWGLGCPVAAVDTFLCLAENAPPEVSHAFVISDAQRGDLFVGEYRRDDHSRWESVGEIGIAAASAWAAERCETDVILGPGVARYRPLLTTGQLLGDEAAIPRAAVVAELGRRLLDQGQAADCWTLEPFYLRLSAAEEKWEQRQGE